MSAPFDKPRFYRGRLRLAFNLVEVGMMAFLLVIGAMICPRITQDAIDRAVSERFGIQLPPRRMAPWT